MKNILRSSRHQAGFSLVEIIMLGVIIVLLGAVGYLAYHALHSHGETQQATAQPTPTAQPLAYKTYTSNATLQKLGLGFTVQYPANWRVDEVDAAGSPNVIFRKAEPTSTDASASRSMPCVAVTATMGGEKESVDEFASGLDSDAVVDPNTGKSISLGPVVKSQEPLTINGLAGTKRTVVVHGEQTETVDVLLKGGVNNTNGTIDGEANANFYRIESCPNTDQSIVDTAIHSLKAQ